MAVSYLSKPFRSSPYVMPLDLNLFTKVMSVKQQQFDMGAQKIQSGIDQLGQLDVMRGVDKEYLGKKINNLVSTINNFGGKDFSDPNILNQIEGLGTDIYGDQNVITALYSTKQVRNLMAGYEQYKTNPKLNKQYSQVNEAYDMQGVNQWLSGDSVGESYKGPSSPTPFTPYKENHIKAFEKIKADLVENTMVDGMYIKKNSTERITPERLMSMAADLLTPEERGQMKRDAWYLYTQQAHLPPEQIVQKSMDQYQQRINETKNMMKYYSDQADAAVADPGQRRSYNMLADQKANELSQMVKDPNSSTQAAINKFKQDPEEFMYQVYSNDYFRGLANRFSVNRTKQDITPNYAEIARQRMEQSASQFDRKLAQDDTHFYDDLRNKAALKGLYMQIDPQTGEISYIPVKGSAETLSSSNVSTEPTSVTEKTIKAANDQLRLDIDKQYNNFLSDFVAHHPELGIESVSGRRLIGQEFLEGINQQPGLQIEDFKGLEDNAVRAQIQAAYKRMGVKSISQNMALLDGLWNNYKAVLDGKGNSVGEVPREFVDVVDKVSMIKERMRANEELMRQSRDEVYDRAGLTDAEKSEYDRYLQSPQDYSKYKNMDVVNRAINRGLDWLGGTSSVADQNIVNIQKKLEDAGVSNIDKEVEKNLQKYSTRNVFKTKTISPTDPYVKKEDVATYLYNEMRRNRGQITVGNQTRDVKASDVEDVAANKITPVETGMYADGTGRFYITGEVTVGEGNKQRHFIYTTPIDDENAHRMGLERDPYESINYSVGILGRSGDIPVYANKNMAVTLNVVKKNANDINSNASFVQAKVFYLDAQGNKISDGRGGFKYDLITIPNTEGETPSVAYTKAYQAIWMAGNNNIKNLTTQEFIDYITNAAKNQIK